MPCCFLQINKKSKARKFKTMITLKDNKIRSRQWKVRGNENENENERERERKMTDLELETKLKKRLERKKKKREMVIKKNNKKQKQQNKKNTQMVRGGKLVGCVLWHINLCRLFNAKSILM